MNTKTTTSIDTTEQRETFFSHARASIASTIILTIICCGAYPLLIYGIAQAGFSGKANGSLVKKDGTATAKPEEAAGSSLLGQAFSLPGYFHPRPSSANNSAGSGYSSGGGYDPTSSGATNYGPLSDELINGATNTPAAAVAPATQPVEHLDFDGVRLRTIHYAVDNGIAFKLYNVSPDGMRTEVPLKNFTDAQGNLNDIALVDAFPHPQNDKPDRVVLIAADFSQEIPADAVTGSASGLDPHITPANAEIQKARIATARNIKPEQVEELIAEHTDAPSLGVFGDPGVNVLMLNIALDAKYPLPAPPATQPTTQPAAK
jgi:K+-transporting ATPase ATPase C chain